MVYELTYFNIPGRAVSICDDDHNINHQFPNQLISR